VSRKKLGKYEIIERIGRGGMAEVYRGYHASLDRYVAIKLLHPFLADDPEFKDRFENEARNVAKLRHPNIVQVYDFEYDEEGDSYYMVMEMINGPTLKDRLFDLAANHESMSLGESIRIIKSAAEALAYAHQRSMIHRDVKPANLMIDEDGRVVLTDFGIAKIVTGAQFTASGGMVGTPAYMAPEQGLGDAGDERSDIYSLGVILYQLITGRLPYDADTPLAIILKHVNSDLPAPSKFADIPEDLEKIVCRALEKEPADRYQTAIAFAQDLGLLDETGHRVPMFDPNTGLPVTAIPSPFDTKPAPPTPAQRGVLAAAAEAAGLTITPPRAPTNPQLIDTPTVPPPIIAGRAPSARGRLRPAGVFGLTAVLIVVVLIALFGFGNNDTPFAGVLGSKDNTNTPQLTGTALALLNLTPSITPTDTPGVTDTPQPTPTLTPTVTPSPTFTDTPTLTVTPSSTPTDTPSPTPTATDTPTPDLTGTAVAHFFETLAAASPTPNMTQTLAACDFEYIVVEPDRYNVPPPINESSNPRLIRAGQDFTLDLVFQNTGSCEWPEGVRLTYNAELTQNPDETVNLAPLREACASTELRPGLNFARQEQSNFFMIGSVGITAESNPITLTGTAPNVFGCYYGVWDLLYPNSSLTIGRPLVLTIRVWGGG
jgi:tRNA A-37 threonylcarbamoyl transferase component Bud32